jgi:hypothetical protein
MSRLSLLAKHLGFFSDATDLNSKPIPRTSSPISSCSCSTYYPALWAAAIAVQVTLLVFAIIYCPPAGLGLLAVAAIGYGIYKYATSSSRNQNQQEQPDREIRTAPHLYD